MIGGRMRVPAGMRGFGSCVVLLVAVACRSEPAEPAKPAGSVEAPSEVDAPAVVSAPVVEGAEADAEADVEAPAVEATPPAEVTPPPVPLPVLDVESPTWIGTQRVWRESKTDRPPWDQVTITELRFGFRPKRGAAVTVLPDDPSLPTLELKIERIVGHRAVKEDDIQASWDAVLEPVTDRAYHDVEGTTPTFPVGVVAVYPATPSARVLDPATLDPAQLPAGTPPGGVSLAVDVNGDGQPDTVERSICTDDPKIADCGEATAWELQRRVEGAWTLVHRFDPST